MNQNMSSLHNRLRPIYISDFSGNPQIFGPKGVLTRLFQRAANSKSILQSIIITGQSGTGKTALSRIYVQLFQQFLVQNNIQHQYSYDVKVIESYEYSKATLNYLHNYTTINVIPVVIIEDFQVLNKPQQIYLQLWEVELLFLVYYVSNYILKYFATSNADDKFQQIISSWRLFMNYSLTQEGQKYDFDRIRPQSTIQSRYLIFQKGKIEITTCNKRTAMTKINAVEDVQGRSTNSLNKLRQF
ncbi:Recombination_factor protein RarA [Hexamita inflata]|uniref:Recombination factor protein RarA n=1 Tax=Hexamita inflata TaxID=28002 RepID=A0AA86U7D0_9EUKA|nr:Recombination factor protein RarA [Hexamita inflata]